MGYNKSARRLEMLSEDEKKRLLEIARKSLESHFEGVRYIPEDKHIPDSRGARSYPLLRSF